MTFQQQKRGSKLKFGEVFPLEYRLVQRFIHGHDFHEGIRASNHLRLHAINHRLKLKRDFSPDRKRQKSKMESSNGARSA